MKRLILLSIIITFAGFVFSQTGELSVKVIVKCDDSNIKNRLKSSLLTELRNKTDVVIKTTSPEFILSANTALISCDTDNLSIVISFIITEKITLEDDSVSYKILSSSLITTDTDKLEEKCKALVAKYDVDFFEPIRQ